MSWVEIAIIGKKLIIDQMTREENDYHNSTSIFLHTIVSFSFSQCAPYTSQSPRPEANWEVIKKNFTREKNGHKFSLSSPKVRPFHHQCVKPIKNKTWVTIVFLSLCCSKDISFENKQIKVPSVAYLQKYDKISRTTKPN